MEVCNILLRMSNAESWKINKCNTMRKFFFFPVKILFVFQSLLRKDNTVKYCKRYGPIENHLPADYKQLEMYTLLHNILGYYRCRACRCVLHKCSILTQTSRGFYCLQYKSFENTEGKGEIAHNEQFLLVPQCFLPFMRTFCNFCLIKKLSPASSFKLEESKICRLGKS